MNSITVQNPGLFTTVQDQGRFGFQESGISPAGVMDSYSHQTANLLVGNHPKEAVLEATLTGPTLCFQTDCLIAVTGAEAVVKINGRPAPMWQSLGMKEGDVLSFEPARRGCRVYIAFAGGLDIPAILGSKSTHCKARMGGINGRPLQRGDKLTLNEAPETAVPYKANTKLIPAFPSKVVLRVVPGPQEDAFMPEGMNAFWNGEYVVTPLSDRMGCRLEGPAITHRTGADIVSDGIVMGAIQVPSSGQPIILMADRQTTGGYTKIATVITADLPLLAQARPGDAVCFCEISVEEAQKEMLAYQEKMKHFEDTMQPVGRLAEGELSIQDVIQLMQEFQNSQIGVFRLSKQDQELYLEKNSGTETGVKPKEVCCREEEGCVVTSPLVGVFYASSSPDQPPFVQVGTAVKKGDPLFVIESMKIMNEILSDRDGVITEILAQNEQTLEFGQPILRMK